MIITDFKDSYMRVQKEEFLLIMTHKCHREIALYDVTNGHAVNRPVTFFFSFSIRYLREDSRSLWNPRYRVGCSEGDQNDLMTLVKLI